MEILYKQLGNSSCFGMAILAFAGKTLPSEHQVLNITETNLRALAFVQFTFAYLLAKCPYICIIENQIGIIYMSV